MDNKNIQVPDIQKPLVSVLIPLYNAAPYIAETLDSLINQLYENIEVIIVDDGSTDNGGAIVKEYEKKYPFIKYILSENKGACHARNLAFRNSKGNYIQYLDADDYLSSDKISKQVNLLKMQSDKTVAYCRFEVFVSNSEATYSLTQLNKDYDKPVDWLIDSWNGKGMNAATIWLVPRKLIELAGDWNEEILKNQDGEFFTRVLLNADKILFVPDVIAYYRKDNPNSISTLIKENKILSQLKSIDLIVDYTLEKVDTSDVRSALVQLYYNLIYHYGNLYKEVLKQSRIRIKDMKTATPPRVGGSKFRMMQKVLGFNLAIKVKKIL